MRGDMESGYETVVDPYGPAAFPLVRKVPGLDRVWVGDGQGVLSGGWVELPCDDEAGVGAEGGGEHGVFDVDWGGPIGDLEGFPCRESMGLGRLSAIERLAASVPAWQRPRVAALVTARGEEDDLLAWANALVEAAAIARGVTLVADYRYESVELQVGNALADLPRMGRDELRDYFSFEEYGRRRAWQDGVELDLGGFYDPSLDVLDLARYGDAALVEIGREAARGRASREEAYTGVKGALLREAMLAAEELAGQPWVSEGMRAHLLHLATNERSWDPWLVVACSDIVSALDDEGEARLAAWARRHLADLRGRDWVSEVANAAAQADEIPYVRFSEGHGRVGGVMAASPERRYADWCLDPDCGGYVLGRGGLMDGFDYGRYGRDLLADGGIVSGGYFVPHDLDVDLGLYSWDEIGCVAGGLGAPVAAEPAPLSRQREEAVSACGRDGSGMETGREAPSQGGQEL